MRSKLALLALLPAVALAGCDNANMPQLKMPKLFAKRDGAAAGGAQTGASSQKLVEREVEAPEVFSVREPGLWDGRPSLGGVWVAYPGVKDPERVIIRNPANDSFVIGALFRRERDNPGPKLQVSSDAAAALGVLAGQPTELEVVALRKKQVAVDTPVTPVSEGEEDVTAETLGPLAAAAAAIEKADAEGKDEGEGAAKAKPKPAATATAASTPAAQPAPQRSTLDKPYVQIGIFSIEANARNTAKRFQSAGVVPTVRQFEARGKKFWRVLIGPAANASERKALLAKARELGFADAYAVKG
ncbi:MAG: SPOR domain-containing protein [Alphaproteobacteria bacterium]|nr:MAG: SPOR domain-containing protein [Alphaproteobacteria bacterium]